MIWTLILIFSYRTTSHFYKDSVFESTIAQIQQNINYPSYEPIHKSLLSLETLGFLRCPKLISLKNQFLYADLSMSSHCRTIDERRMSVTFIGSNGDELELSGMVQLPFVYKILLYGIYGLGLLLLVGTALVLRKQDLFETTIREQELRWAEEINNVAFQLAHDLRAPLSALNILVSNLATADETTRSLAQSISSRVSAIAEDLLKRRKLNTKTSENITAQPTTRNSKIFEFNLNALLANLVEEAKLLAEEKSGQIHFKIYPSNEPINIHPIDGQSLSRIVLNLLKNGVDAIGDAGFVTVEAVKLSEEYSIAIRDNGCGMAEDDIEKALLGATSKDHGNGIGLSSAKNKVSAAGGHLSINSTVGGGTKVELRFPLLGA